MHIYTDKAINELVFDLAKLEAELAVLRDIASAARAVHDSEVVWGSFGVGAARVGVVTWNALTDALDAYDALVEDVLAAFDALTRDAPVIGEMGSQLVQEESHD